MFLSCDGRWSDFVYLDHVLALCFCYVVNNNKDIEKSLIRTCRAWMYYWLTRYPKDFAILGDINFSVLRTFVTRHIENSIKKIRSRVFFQELIIHDFAMHRCLHILNFPTSVESKKNCTKVNVQSILPRIQIYKLYKYLSI